MKSTDMMRRLARRAAAALASMALAGAAWAQNAPMQAAFERAMADYNSQHYAAAHQALWVLADSGHAESARIALLMAVHGPRLYGMKFNIGPVQRERWLAAALPVGHGGASGVTTAKLR